jgi:hypothetical protein
MIMGARGNVLLAGQLRRWFATDEAEAALRPVLAQEEFNVHG